MGLVRRRWNRRSSARARNIGTGATGLFADYPIPILLPTDVFLNLNRVLITVDVTLLLWNLTLVYELLRGGRKSA